MQRCGAALRRRRRAEGAEDSISAPVGDETDVALVTKLTSRRGRSPAGEGSVSSTSSREITSDLRGLFDARGTHVSEPARAGVLCRLCVRPWPHSSGTGAC